MIKTKKCKCGCGNYPTIGFKGFNYRCVSQEFRDAKRRQYSIKQKPKEATKNDELEKWFEFVATTIKSRPFCWECNAPISKSDYRNASAHIFPKSIFKSVMTHPLNFLVLGSRCGCHEKSHRIDTFSKMKVWPVACQRFFKFKNQITETHKYLSLFMENIDRHGEERP